MSSEKKPIMDLSSYRGLPVLVTGAGGFVGSHLCKALDQLGAHVTALLRPDKPYPRLDGLDVDRVYGDLVDAQRVSQLLSTCRPQAIFHLAASLDRKRGLKSLDRLLESNIMASLNIFRAAAAIGCEVLVCAGDSEEYGRNAPPFKESQEPDPLTPYAASKATVAMWGRTLHRSLGLNCITARLFLIYGPGQSEDTFLAQLLKAQRSGQPLLMTAGDQTRDFTWIDDAVTALVSLGRRPELGGQIFNVCTGHETSLRDAVDTLGRLSGKPVKADFGALPYRESELFREWGSPYSLHGAIGFKPKTTLEEGLGKMLATE